VFKLDFTAVRGSFEVEKHLANGCSWVFGATFSQIKVSGII